MGFPFPNKLRKKHFSLKKETIMVIVLIFISCFIAIFLRGSWRYINSDSLRRAVLTECRKTITKEITLPNHKGRRAIHCLIKTLGNYTKHGKTCASGGFGFTCDLSRRARDF